MPYAYFDHQADIGILGIGKTQTEAFEQAALAMFEFMGDLKSVASKKAVCIDAKGNDLETLFVAWLNALLAQKEIHDMFFSKFKVEKIEKRTNEYVLIGRAWGEKLDLKKHKLQTEVKAASYSQLKVWEEKGLYKAQCVVDV